MFPYHRLTPPSSKEIEAARRTLGDHIQRTPLVRSEWLSEELDTSVYFKREDTLPTGAFKVRGGLTLCDRLDDEFTERGVIAASTGNHGQSIAYAGREFDVPVTVVVPEDANPSKVRAIERFGGTVRHHGVDYDEARKHAEHLARTERLRYVHSANEPDLIAGVATAGLEVEERLSSVDTVVCPVGGGSGASGYSLTVGSDECSIIGVQAQGADSMYRAWQTGELTPQDSIGTDAEGLQSRVPFALTTSILREHLSDMVLVSDAEIFNAVSRLLTEENVLVEGAAGAAVAGALTLDPDRLGRNVVVQLSGRNISQQRLQSIVCRPD